MLIRIQYNSIQERERIIGEHSDKFLITEENITEGNFLTFTDAKPIELEIQETKDRLTQTEADNEQLKTLLADLTEVVLMGV